MKRQKEDTEVMVYRYGLLHPEDWGADVETELRGQVDLWNRLLEIEEAHVARVRAVALEDDQVAAAEAKRAALAETYAEAQAARKARNKAARARVHEPPEIMAALKARLAEATAAAREARTAAYAAAKPQLSALEAERYDAVKRAYHETVCWWCNANAVIASYQRARSRKGKRELRAQHYNGEGRLTNQIQGGITVAQLFAGAHSQVRVGPPPPGRANTNGKRAQYPRLLTVTAFVRDGVRRNVSFVMLMHRPIPEEWRIKEVTVHRSRVADGSRWSVSFLCSRPKREPVRPSGDPVAINLGWRLVPQGLRVATALRADGEEMETILGKRLIARFEYGQRSAEESDEPPVPSRDDILNLIVADLRKLDWRAAPGALAEQARDVLRAPIVSRGRLVGLWRLWRFEHASYQPKMLRELNAWRVADRETWRGDANRMRWAIDARTDFYRREAIRLIGDARKVIINAHDMRETAKAEGSDLPGPARHNRVIAAPSEMRKALRLRAIRIGAEVVEYSEGNSECAECGTPWRVRDRAALFWHCHGCGRSLDQDENYVRLMLREPGAVGDGRKVRAA